MEPNELIPLVAVIIATVLFLLYWREIMELIQNIRGGGPRPPTHPLPANDGFVPRRGRPISK